MLKTNYYIWLQEALGIGANVGSRLQFFGSAEAIYNASEDELRTCGLFSGSQIEKLLCTSIDNSYKTISECALNGIDIIIPEDELYPERLKEIENYPLVLYVSGDISCLNELLPIAIVGTRKPEGKSMGAAKGLASVLSRCGFTVVSGGALGVDTAAHTGAICAGGKTVAVLGGGIESGYLMENAKLRDAISAQGALISESPPYAKPQKGCFPLRNRIIAGLTVGTIVVEAGRKSGSLITSKYAGDFSRDVFAVPAECYGVSNAGVKELLEDGAEAVFKAEDVLCQYMRVYGSIIETHIVKNDVSELEITTDLRGIDSTDDFKGYAFSEKPKKSHDPFRQQKAKKRRLAETASDTARRVYNCFDGEPLSINSIAEKAMMPINSVMGAITELEILGYVELTNTAKYILK